MLALTASIAAGYVSNNSVPVEMIPDVINSIHSTLSGLSSTKEAQPEPVAPTPAVDPKRSVFPDYIVCLEDGKQLTMLKRHLHTAYGMTPDEYRKKWGLPGSYPMVAPKYAETRSQMAKEMGLGRSRTSAMLKKTTPARGRAGKARKA